MHIRIFVFASKFNFEGVSNKLFHLSRTDRSKGCLVCMVSYHFCLSKMKSHLIPAVLLCSLYSTSLGSLSLSTLLSLLKTRKTSFSIHISFHKLSVCCLFICDPLLTLSFLLCYLYTNPNTT